MKNILRPALVLFFILTLVTGVAYPLVATGVAQSLFPDSMRRAKLRRIRAVRVVLKQLKRAHTATDPAAETALAFRRYLTARFSMTPFAQTPEEVHAALMQLLHPNADDARNFLWECDTNRFSVTSDNSLSLPRQAEALVLNWEGVLQ